MDFKYTKIIFLSILLILLLAACTSTDSPPSSPINEDTPNIIIIVTDDQRYGTMDFMPKTQELLFDQGVTFENAYVTTPSCCPSRSSILTGRYVHNHQVYDNKVPLKEEIVVNMLDGMGYFTGIVGKYLNSYGRSPNDLPNPAFDYWVAHGTTDVLPNKGKNFYTKPTLNVQGEWITHDKYLTALEGDYVDDFLDQALANEAPFFLLFAPFAPHIPAVPEPAAESLYPDLPPNRPPSFNFLGDEDDLPQFLVATKLTEEDIARIDRFRRKQLQTLYSVDVEVEALVARLEEAGVLDDTVIFFLSDNGQLWGEHRLSSKFALYEEAIHVPFTMVYPELIPTPYIEEALIANIDITPTIYDLVGVPIPDNIDGRSLLPLLTQTNDSWRTDIVIEGYKIGYNWHGIHTGESIYVETRYDTGEVFTQLYDMTTDPYQLNNLYDDPDYTETQKELKERLAAYNIPEPPITSHHNIRTHKLLEFYGHYHLVLKAVAGIILIALIAFGASRILLKKSA